MTDKVLIHSSSRTTSSSLVLIHHGILGQKWGQKNGPPYPLKGGSIGVGIKGVSNYNDYKKYIDSL